MKPFVDGLRKRGVDATAIDLPKRKAEEAIPAFHLVVPSEADVAVGFELRHLRLGRLGDDLPRRIAEVVGRDDRLDRLPERLVR